MKVKELIELYTRQGILNYAQKRTDLGMYDEDCLIDFVLENQNRDIDEALDEFSEIEKDNRIENRKDFLFDDLNNILFEKHSEITEYIEEWLEKYHLPKDDLIVWELAGDFIDQKELYDLDYED